MAELNDDYPVVHEGGDVRKLCARPVDDDTPTPTPQHTFAETPTTRLIPETEWTEVDMSAHVSPIKDQNGVGACNCFATIAALEACRRMKGLPDVLLSPGDLYSRINGGRDNGSLPEDALKVALSVGVATAATVPQLQWRSVVNSADAVAERPKYRFLEALWCPTARHVGSAIQQGFFIDAASWWWQYDEPDQDGWLPVTGRGSRGGHAYLGCGWVRNPVTGIWGLKKAGSWSARWNKAGFGYIPMARIDEGCRVFRVWAVREVVQEAGDLPVPKFG